MEVTHERLRPVGEFLREYLVNPGGMESEWREIREALFGLDEDEKSIKLGKGIETEFGDRFPCVLDAAIWLGVEPCSVIVAISRGSAVGGIRIHRIESFHTKRIGRRGPACRLVSPDGGATQLSIGHAAKSLNVHADTIYKAVRRQTPLKGHLWQWVSREAA